MVLPEEREVSVCRRSFLLRGEIHYIAAGRMGGGCARSVVILLFGRNGGCGNCLGTSMSMSEFFCFLFAVAVLLMTMGYARVSLLVVEDGFLKSI